MPVRWIQTLPVVCLLCVAFNQTRLVVTEDLSHWSGGGFGMFSTTDAATDRHLHIYEVTETLRREVPLPTGLEEAVRRVLTLPNDAQMRKLATLLIEQRRVSPLNRIEIQVWSSHYDPQDLRPRSALLRYYRSDAALPP